jgi:hypothetical protein
MTATVYSQNSAVNSTPGASISTSLAANLGDTVEVRLMYTGNSNQQTTISCMVNGVAATYAGQAPCGNTAITFVTAPSGASGSTTITGTFPYGGTYPVLLSTGQVVNFNFPTNGTNIANWSTPITGTPTTAANVYFSTGYNVATYIAQNVAAGTLAVSATIGGSGALSAVSAIDITGVTASSFQSFMPSYVAPTGATANAIISNTLTTTGAVLISAFSFDWQASASTATQTVGTTLAWTAETAVWTNLNTLNNTNPAGLGQYLNVPSSGSTVATFGASSTNQYNGFSIGMVAYNVATTSPNTAYNPIKTGTTPLDATGDAGRVALTKVNDDMVAVYSALGGRATTPGCVGISSTTGTTTTLVDSTQTWATNQFFGQYVTITTGSLPTSSGGVTTATSNLGYSALIASNTSTTLTFATLPYATSLGCGYEISPVPATAYTDGLATSVGGTAPSTIVDGTKSWTTNAWAGYQVTPMGGPYAGKAFPIASNTATTLTLNSNLTTAIAAGTPYVIGTRSGLVRQKITAGTSATIANGTGIVQIIGPTTMALTTPANPVDGDIVRITNNGTSTITTFSIVANSGQTGPTVPATLTAQQGIAIYYEADTTTWYRSY